MVKMPLDIHISAENPQDRHKVRAVNEAAFGRTDEADLVEGLREQGVILLSLVAELHSEIVGHILFTRMAIDTPQGAVPAVALAPMAVLPSSQRRQIGGSLVQAGLDELRVRGEHVVLVLGHQHYYPRFGFSSEKARPISSPFPPDAFMALELTPGALLGVRGEARYPAAFGL